MSIDRRGSFNPRRGDPPKQEHRTNDQIRVPQVRLIGEDFEEISRAAGETVEAGIFPTFKALQWAQALDMDLIEISATATPPVVKILEYSKFLYQKRKREKELKANTVKMVMKEIRFGPETAEHDFEFKVKHAKTFLEEGSKVKAYVQFRGRAIVFKDRGELLLLRFMKELEEVGIAEQMPKLEGRRMLVILTPKKGVKK